MFAITIVYTIVVYYAITSPKLARTNIFVRTSHHFAITIVYTI